MTALIIALAVAGFIGFQLALGVTVGKLLRRARLRQEAQEVAS